MRKILGKYRSAACRWTVVGATALTLSGAAYAQDGAALTPVTMQLDWVLAGPNAGFMIAKEKGFYEEEGLDVTINQGKGSGNTAQLVASKAVDFGFSDGYVVANSISKGADITMVARSEERRGGKEGVRTCKSGGGA